MPIHQRFIPVDTGNTPEAITKGSSPAVHPRGYGEHAVIFGILRSIDGSSPWIRGTLQYSETSQCSCRFIPVDTGNTNAILNTTGEGTVHPRGYGEHN